MELKEIISKIIFEHLDFNNGNVNVEGLIEELTKKLELNGELIQILIYRTINKLSMDEAKKIAQAIKDYKHLLYKHLLTD